MGLLTAAICPLPIPLCEWLQPDERRFASGLAEWRRREWLAGRLCLGEAIAHFTDLRPPMLPTPSGAPTMPSGLVGSISHKGPLAAALVTSGKAGIGVDVEQVEEIDATLAKKVLTPREYSSIAALDDRLKLQRIVSYFSIKEAVYKSLDPARQSDIEFDDIEVDVTAIVRTEWFAAEATVRGYAVPFSAGVLIDGQWVLAVAARTG